MNVSKPLFFCSKYALSAKEIVPCSARPKRHVIFFSDVKLCTAIETNMDDSAANSKACSSKRKRGGRYCVAGAPNKRSCKNNSYTDGISMHQFPTDPVVRNKWVKFVQRHRVDFHESSVTNYTSLCSAHFEESCYTRKISLDLGEQLKRNKVLIRGSILRGIQLLPKEQIFSRIEENAK